MDTGLQKPLQAFSVEPPPIEQRVRRDAAFAKEGERRTRHSLPNRLSSNSPVGYRTRINMTREEVEACLPLLNLERPTSFTSPQPITEQQLFEECSLGILSSRQSTNYRGHKQTTLGPEDSKRLATLLNTCDHLEAPALENASYTHVVFSRPYRTPFTLLLTMIGHKPFLSLFTVPWRGIVKKLWHVDDIPTIGYLQQLHIGILADAMERAAVIASAGQRKAQIFMAPFCNEERRKTHQTQLTEIEAMCGLTAKERRQGWRIALVAQVGEVQQEEQLKLSSDVARKVGANILSFRSERVQPGVNADAKSPEAYQHRQEMNVSDAFTEQAGRAAYNAFCHWTGVDRDKAKELLLLERIDVLTPGGKERIREVRKMLNDVTDKVIVNLPKWADLPTGKLFSRTVDRGRKAFALAGQRIYLGGLSKSAIEASGLDWTLGIRAVGATSARSGLYCELMGVMNLPEDCDLLAGFCMMAGPINQNDVGKSFFEEPDLLEKPYPGQDPTSMLVWTLKAKTIADPIGNEEQLMNAKQKGALVDLRPGPHDIIQIRKDGQLTPMRKRDGRTNEERAFADLDNFVTAPDGQEIPGNKGHVWPQQWANEIIWPL
ncbi:MAG: hypothetical protein CL920_39185 [Deltaproteobacteria bacterium]|nr:hypothetical protein [Deltaproteobacteria bacterium]MBU54760.1 hypothetical protein [Deltaproteobacteria bacterium]